MAESSLAHRYQSLQQRWKNAAAKSEVHMEQIGRTLIVGGTSFVAGFVSGRFGNKFDLGGIPFELSAALAAHGLGFFSKSEKQQELAHNIGDGFTAAYMTTLGRTAGSTSAAGK